MNALLTTTLETKVLEHMQVDQIYRHKRTLQTVELLEFCTMEATGETCVMYKCVRLVGEKYDHYVAAKWIVTAKYFMETFEEADGVKLLKGFTDGEHNS